MAKRRGKKRSDPSSHVSAKATLPAGAAPAQAGRTKRWVLALAASTLIAAAAGYFYLSGPPSAPATNLSSSTESTRFMGGADAGYVDPSACAACHKEIYDSYQRSGMGRSFYSARPELIAADIKNQSSYYHKPSDRYYTILEKNGSYFQRRHQLDTEGNQTNVFEKEIHYVMGSGNHARTYLHREADGKLVQLPLGWYAANGGFLAMNPGYDQPKHRGFRREITFDCMFCHNGYPSMAPGEDGDGREARFRGAIPEGIDCQRCHGPGQAHIKAVAEAASVETIHSTIVNPSRLSTERQLELCMQCHLETTSNRLPHALRRFGRGAFSYRPGEALADYMLHFDHPAGAGYDDKFEIAHAAYRLRKSACFQQTAALPAGQAMTCTTCHDPHDIPRGEAATQHYIGVCRNCHGADLDRQVAAGRHAAEKDCLACHMPKRRTDDVVHVVMTDHYIQRHQPARDLLAPLQEIHTTSETEYRGEVDLYYPSVLPDERDRDLYLALAQVADESNLDHGTKRLAAAIEKHRPAEASYYFQLAEAYSKKGERTEASRFYEAALERQPGHAQARINFSTALSQSGQLDRAAQVLQEGLRLEPGNAAMLSNLGDIYNQGGDFAKAAEALTEAIRLDPDLPDAFHNMANARAGLDDPRGAEEALRNAIRIQPDFELALNNLANFLAEKGQSAEAETYYQKAVEISPAYAEARYNYATFLAGQQRMKEAEALLRQALRIDPRMANAHNNLGNLLASQGRTQEAISHFRSAVESDPKSSDARLNLGVALLTEQKRSEAKSHVAAAIGLNPEHHRAHFIMGVLLADEGSPGEAEKHLRKAAESTDPQIRQPARDALKEIQAVP